MINDISCDECCNIFKALGHPVRLKIVNLLIYDNICSVNKLCELLGLPQSTTSQHLSILKKARVVSCNKTGLEACYFVSNEKVKEIIYLMKN